MANYHAERLSKRYHIDLEELRKFQLPEDKDEIIEIVPTNLNWGGIENKRTVSASPQSEIVAEHEPVVFTASETPPPIEVKIWGKDDLTNYSRKPNHQAPIEEFKQQIDDFDNEYYY